MSRSSATPRVVVVSRATEYEALLARHGTRQQAEFFLSTRGQSIEGIDRRHSRFHAAMDQVLSAIPVPWRRSRIERDGLDRFPFEPDDIVVAVGQDGLVPNVAKYLEGQRLIGINSDPEEFDGVLVQHEAVATGDLLADVAAGRSRLEARTMVEARLDDGQRLLALNEVFIGHRTHQSARYRLRWSGREERQSSSGIIISTGTGATGWARSLSLQRRDPPELPAPEEPSLAFFVREAFPSVVTGTSLTSGRLGGGDGLTVHSEMNDDGVIFGDGIEDDRLRFPWGVRARLEVADSRLLLVAA